MKILFLGTSEFDYLQDLTFCGLVKVLGRKNIYEYSVNPHYLLPIRKYPRNIGYAGFDPGFFKRFYFRDVDCVIVPAAKPICFEFYESIIPKIKPSVKTIFIDGGDWPEIGGDLKRLNNNDIYQRVNDKRPFDIIFKRELLKNTRYNKNIHPLPFSINANLYSNIPILPFKYDVCFWAVESHPIRTQALHFLESHFDCLQNGTVLNQNFRKYKRKGKKYFKELIRSRILLNLRGAGWDTLRYWEILGLQRFMLSQRLDILIPNDFIEDKEIVYFKNDLSDLEDLCNFYLKNEELREQIAGRAHQKAMLYHTDVARAKYILKAIEKV